MLQQTLLLSVISVDRLELTGSWAKAPKAVGFLVCCGNRALEGSEGGPVIEPSFSHHSALYPQNYPGHPTKDTDHWIRFVIKRAFLYIDGQTPTLLYADHRRGQQN